MGYVEELRAVVGNRPLILVGSVVIVLNESKQILLQHRNQHPFGKWGLPGGLMELGESMEDTARREVFEETNLRVGGLQLIDILSGPNNYIKAPNGDEFYMVTAAYFTREVEGELSLDAREGFELRFFHTDELPERMVGSHKSIVDRFLLQYDDLL
jgi:ADP-ribose pyrophosphatase YjhB (NUDIX family)